MGNRICCGRWRRGAVEERLTRPQRMSRQPSNLDYKKLRRLIRSEKLAPCFDAEDEPRFDLEECPICFLYFPSLNRSRCCAKGICTECFLQMKPSATQASAWCPFCKTSGYAVEYRGAKSDEEKALEQVEEQKVIEAKIRMQSQDSRNVNLGMLVDDAHSMLEVHLPRHCFQELHDDTLHSSRITERDSNLPLEGNADVDADDSLPSSSGSRGEDRRLDPLDQGSKSAMETKFEKLRRLIRQDEWHADCEDLVVMEAIWRSLKDPHLWSNGILHTTNLETGVPIHVKEGYSNSRVVISKDFFEQLSAEPRNPTQSVGTQNMD